MTSKDSFSFVRKRVFLYLENHALDAWFSKAYSGEDDKELQIG